MKRPQTPAPEPVLTDAEHVALQRVQKFRFRPINPLETIRPGENTYVSAILEIRRTEQKKEK